MKFITNKILLLVMILLLTNLALHDRNYFASAEEELAFDADQEAGANQYQAVEDEADDDDEGGSDINADENSLINGKNDDEDGQVEADSNDENNSNSDGTTDSETLAAQLTATSSSDKQTSDSSHVLPTPQSKTYHQDYTPKTHLHHHRLMPLINQTVADSFSNWIDVKSDKLYALSMNYSGFNLLNETYNIQLRKDARFFWINFTEMIVNISSSISQVLYNKTLLVKNMSDQIEKAFNDYANNSDRVIDSTKHFYYDAKSPKTFCDVAESYNQRVASKNAAKMGIKLATVSSTNSVTTKAAKTSSSSSSSSPPPPSTVASTTESTRPVRISKRSINNHFFFSIAPTIMQNVSTIENDFDNLGSEVDIEERVDNMIKQQSHQHIFSPHHHYHHNEEIKHSDIVQIGHRQQKTASNIYKKEKGESSGGSSKSGNNPKNTKKPSVTNRKAQTGLSTTEATTTTTTTTEATTIAREDSEQYEYDEYQMDDPSDDPNVNSQENMEGVYWDIPCINRTYDENFKSVQKINRNKSTVQVPINVYKQDIAINMTAYWTEALDDMFKKNYDEDNDNFWQYFCSSQGLFRRYPAAYWTVGQNNLNDFFDCRLQTWYIMAAASPKDVIILLDISGSMTGLRLEIGKKLIEFILDTLTDNDFFNILTFSNSVQYLFHNESAYMDTFVQAGKNNKEKYKRMLETYKNTSQQARLTLPLTKVFNLFNKRNIVRINFLIVRLLSWIKAKFNLF